MRTPPLKLNKFGNYSFLRRHVRVLWRFDVPSLLDQLPKKNFKIIQENKIFLSKW